MTVTHILPNALKISPEWLLSPPRTVPWQPRVKAPTIKLQHAGLLVLESSILFVEKI
jgi:hypothetical protein